MKAKFTKGEWYIHPNGIGCGGASIVSIDKCDDSVFSIEEELANLMLIQSAPKMHEILLVVSEFLGDMHSQPVELTIKQSVLLKVEICKIIGGIE